MNSTDLSVPAARTGMSFQHFPDLYRPYSSLHETWQLPDGSSLVMGAIHAGGYEIILYRLTPEGTLDTNFAADGTVPGILHPRELIASADLPFRDFSFADMGADGTIWAFFSTVNDRGPALARLSNNGQLDPTFNAGGTVPGILDIELGIQTGVIGFDVLDDGSLRLATLTSIQEDGTWHMTIDVLRIDAAGQRTSEMSLQLGDVSALSMEAIFYLEDGSMLLQARDYASNASLLARVNAQGQLDMNFNNEEGHRAGVLVVPSGQEWLILPNGGLLHVDYPRLSQSGLDVLTSLTLTLRNADGSKDSTFSAGHALAMLNQGFQFNPSAFDVAALADGKFIVATGDDSGVQLLRLNADGSLDVTFNPTGATPGLTHVLLDSVYSVDTLEISGAADGSLTLSGSQVFFNFSARLLSDGTLDTTYGALTDQGAASVNGDQLPALISGPLIGGLGLDWANFEGLLAEHRVSAAYAEPWSGPVWKVDATDHSLSVQTYGVERLRFDDLSLAIDTGVLYLWAGWWPYEQWTYAGNAAAIVASLWGTSALQDARLVGEVLAYVDILGAKSTLERLMAAPELFGIEGSPSTEDWLQRMHVNLVGQEASPERLQQIIKQSENGPSTASLLQILGADPTVSKVLHTLFLPFGESLYGLVYKEFEGLVQGTGQNDSLRSRAIDDHIDGGAGLDEVVYGRPADDFTIGWLDDGALRVQGPGDTVDLLWNIERLRFGDITLAFDLAEGQSANQAARMITALVGSDALSDQPLVRNVVEHIDRLGFEAVTSLLIDSGIAASYAGGTDVEALVATVYANLQGTAGTAEDLQWHQDFVAQAGWSAVDVLRFGAQHALTAQRMDLVEMTGQGLAYTAPYYDVFNLGGL